MIRCVMCGCSRLDAQGYKCTRCGDPPSFRTERCYITEDTKAKLTAHAEELKAFGVTLEEDAIPEDEVLRLRLDEPEQVLSYYRADKAAGK